jgi:hypothetical protein
MSGHDSFRFGIATGGRHRGEVRNKTVSLEEVCAKLSKPLEDHSVTFAEYMRMSVDEKGERKAMAGFVMFAHFTDGKRKAANQKNRTALAFDLDNVLASQLSDIRQGFAPICRYLFAMHTTRSHCPEKPRVRIIMPISRPVNDAEFYALCRLVACLLADTPEEGIEIPDPVSFKYNQVMYWPSISKGQEFWFEENEGEILDVDGFLAGFPTWADLSTLPQQAKAAEARLTEAGAKAEDPTLKKGGIGAFCRAFPVSEAISEFLPDIYAPGDQSTEPRYTYLLGTGANGAIVYDDDRFLHSHHGSDPAEGLHNSWDLVRIHKFGHLDDKAHGNAGPTSLPSHKAMLEMVQKNATVKVEMAAGLKFDDEDDSAEDDSVDEASGDAGGLDFDDDIADLVGEVPQVERRKDKPNRDWAASLRLKASGELEPVVFNATLICSNDVRIAPCVGYNELTLDPVAFKPLRMKKMALPSAPVDPRRTYRAWQQTDDLSVQLIFSSPQSLGGYQFDPSLASVQSAVVAAGKQNSFHPVRDMIQAHHAAWKRAGAPTGLIDRLPQTYLGAADNAFHRESSRMLMIAIVARTFEPGCKFDCVTIIRGAQGARKSTFWKTLAGHPEFFGELPKDFTKTDRMIEAMRGKTILEMAELAGLRKETAEDAKEFITRASDRHRLAYASRVDTYPRQSVLVATSNKEKILHDPTGNRRYWIWEDGHDRQNPIDVPGLEAALPMLYGEAYQAYLDMRRETNGDLWLDLRSKESIDEASRLAGEYRELTATEVIAERIAEWLEEPVSAREIEAPGADKFDADEGDQWFLRNVTSARELFRALKDDPDLTAYRNADVRTYGRALASLPGWEFQGQARRFGEKDRWYGRVGGGPERYVRVVDVTEARQEAERLAECRDRARSLLRDRKMGALPGPGAAADYEDLI